jgi:hypothetical protein
MTFQLIGAIPTQDGDTVKVTRIDGALNYPLIGISYVLEGGSGSGSFDLTHEEARALRLLLENAEATTSEGQPQPETGSVNEACLENSGTPRTLPKGGEK